MFFLSFNNLEDTLVFETGGIDTLIQIQMVLATYCHLKLAYQAKVKNVNNMFPL